MKSKISLLAIAAISALAATSSQGAVLSDTFTYADGPIVGAIGSPWINHSGTAGQAKVASNALSLNASDSEDINAPLAGQPYTTGTLTTTFDVTFTGLPTSSGSYFAHFKDNSTGFRGRLTAATTGAAAGAFRLGISNDGGNTVFVPSDLALNTAYAVSFSWDLDNKLSSLAIDGGTAVTDSDTSTAISVTSFAFRQATGIGTSVVDNLVVTAIPEPSAALLGGLGLLALLRRRR